MIKRSMVVPCLISLSFLVWAIVFAESGPVVAAERTFYVSPQGSDDNPGTRARPFTTVEKARDAVRARNRKTTGDIEVVLRGGTYRIDHTIVLDHRDSGTGGHDVVYRNHSGETPVISGAKPISGWQLDENGRWKARSPIENFRQLHVAGRRAVRARGAPPEGLKLYGEDGYQTPDEGIADWKNPSDLELCYYVEWTHTRCKVRGVTRDGEHAVISMLQPRFNDARNKQGVRVGLPNYIENALELLDEPGEWCLDRQANMVYYMPRPGEDMRTARVVAPAIEKLLELRGTLDAPVHNIRFEGITFADGGWLGPSKTGHVESQANFVNDLNKLHTSVKPYVTTIHHEMLKSPSNIVCRAARSIRFERCTFTRLGGGGIDLEYGSQDNVISGCRFYDISGTAIQVGDVLKTDHHPSDERMIVRNNAVVNNYIRDCCVEYMGGVGIFAGYVAETTIAHNEISNLPYSGISIGWGWGELDAGGGAYHQPFRYDTPTPMKSNRIQHNHIHHVMQSLNDGGGIYTLGNMPGTIIRGNHIHDNRGIPGGIYLDEGSGFIEVTGNVVYGARIPMNYNNRNQNRIATCNVHDNFFDPDSKQNADWPPEARKIIDHAGLEADYRDLLQP